MMRALLIASLAQLAAPVAAQKTLGPTCAKDGKVVVAPEAAAEGVYVIYPTDADKDRDGFVVSSGRVAAFGKANTRWQFVGKVAEGYRYKKVN